MIHFVLNITLILFGALYALRPALFLKRKFPQEKEISPFSLRAARVVGCALALLGVVGLVFTLFS